MGLSKNTYYAIEDGHFYFKIFGYGLCFKNLRKHMMLFSERNGYRNMLIIKRWMITGLKKAKNENN